MRPFPGTIAVTGSAGQLGRELCRQLADAAIPLPRSILDVTSPGEVATVLGRLRPEAVIHCAAWTAVDAAEQEREACFAANATAVATLADACRERGATLVQVSTDYVFGADRDRRTPYLEDDPPGPVNVYGESKLAGEKAAASLRKHLVVRTCGLYSAGDGGPRRGRNFADTMLVLSRDREEIRVVDDQHCTPSFVPHVAAAILALLAVEATGTFHVVNGGATTWHGFAAELLRAAGRTTRAVPIPSAEYPTPAERPHWSVLSTAKLAALGIVLPPWEEGIRGYLGSEAASTVKTSR